MTDKNDGFAFPQSNPDVAYSDYIGGGMTLRDYIAIHAPWQLSGVAPFTWEECCKARYAYADAMIAAREVKP